MTTKFGQTNFPWPETKGQPEVKSIADSMILSNLKIITLAKELESIKCQSLCWLRRYCTPDKFWDWLCIFLKNYNTLVTSKICLLGDEKRKPCMFYGPERPIFPIWENFLQEKAYFFFSKMPCFKVIFAIEKLQKHFFFKLKKKSPDRPTRPGRSVRP